MFELQHITKQFSDKFVLQDFSFKIAQGDKINIAGRSGIGKTTLFRLLLGFEQPDSGTILYENKALNETSVWELRKKVAYVSQDLNIGRGNVQAFFDETLSLKANLAHKTNSKAEIKQYFALFELSEDLLSKNIEELSGGEKQRIAIINALLLKRTIFFLDEITSALDKVLKTKVLDYFLQNPEFTVLYISHDNYLPSGVELKTLKLD
ncbi:MAG: ATP-binding cassette domain-containing protein [Paludibacter sp.]|nr:ATP-binding cassette domain-containing protein [Paludibacter sp.]